MTRGSGSHSVASGHAALASLKTNQTWTTLSWVSVTFYRFKKHSIYNSITLLKTSNSYYIYSQAGLFQIKCEFVRRSDSFLVTPWHVSCCAAVFSAASAALYVCTWGILEDLILWCGVDKFSTWQYSEFFLTALRGFNPFDFFWFGLLLTEAFT